ncbi:hypothetical protein [Desulfosporosinus sp. Sb-LF]|uniref:hypothetical protein n=1 Tax=Desulfosporosinus sp. Sb-LF TaxID=2560027 RepID=UPI0013052B87|nr:hypothetical protein [Desulfosporosinus sp. Sb-LF]
MTSLVLGRGLENMRILLGSMFREGILVLSLTLNTANFMVTGIAFLTLPVTWFGF